MIHHWTKNLKKRINNLEFVFNINVISLNKYNSIKPQCKQDFM